MTDLPGGELVAILAILAILLVFFRLAKPELEREPLPSVELRRIDLVEVQLTTLMSHMRAALKGDAHAT